MTPEDAIKLRLGDEVQIASGRSLFGIRARPGTVGRVRRVAQVTRVQVMVGELWFDVADIEMADTPDDRVQ